MWDNPLMPERWTKERRVEHTRTLLLDAAEDTFARKGLTGAALEDIADAAGYTRGAIYAHFGTKEELFLAVIDRRRDRFLDGFREVIGTFRRLDDLDVDKLAARWHEIGSDPFHAALNYELTLLLLRNPAAERRLTEQRREIVRAVQEFIDKELARMGAGSTMSTESMARLILAVNDSVTLTSHLDGVDLFRPYLQLIISGLVPAGSTEVMAAIVVPQSEDPHSSDSPRNE